MRDLRVVKVPRGAPRTHRLELKNSNLMIHTDCYQYSKLREKSKTDELSEVFSGGVGVMI